MNCLSVPLDWQVEIQGRKVYCINRAIPTLPINLEDAARSEAEFEKAEQVRPLQILSFAFFLFAGGAQLLLYDSYRCHGYRMGRSWYVFSRTHA